MTLAITGPAHLTAALRLKCKKLAARRDADSRSSLGIPKSLLLPVNTIPLSTGDSMALRSPLFILVSQSLCKTWEYDP